MRVLNKRYVKKEEIKYCTFVPILRNIDMFCIVSYTKTLNFFRDCCIFLS